MKDYEMVVGLEVHAELNTKSKIYCNCRNAFGLEVNSQVCPVCMGMPGTLPTLNEKVVEYAIKMGHAMHCQINGVCKQDRKTTSIRTCRRHTRSLRQKYRFAAKAIWMSWLTAK